MISVLILSFLYTPATVTGDKNAAADDEIS